MVITMLEQIKAYSEKEEGESKKAYQDILGEILRIIKDGAENPDTTRITMDVTQLMFNSKTDEEMQALVSALTILLYEQSLSLNAAQQNENGRRPAGFSAN